MAYLNAFPSMERAVEQTALSRNGKSKKNLKKFFSDFLRRFLTFSYVVKIFFKLKKIFKCCDSC